MAKGFLRQRGVSAIADGCVTPAGGGLSCLIRRLLVDCVFDQLFLSLTYMIPTTVAIDSKLPWVGTTIFTVMSRLATDCGAINLSQGFPDFQADPALFEATLRAMREGRNQYPPMIGMPELRTAIAQKVEALYGQCYDAEQEITVTAGATQAIFTAIAAFVRGGDEVIVFAPFYDSYVPSIETVGGKAVYAQLKFPDYKPDWDQVRSLISARTRMIIINSPNNPTGSLLEADDLAALADLTRNTDIVVLSDEVYEHIVFDGARHASVATHPELAARSIVVSSFGKTYHITGWKIGYVLGAAELMTEFRKVHQFNVFTVNTPCQIGIADYMRDASRHLGLAAFYQQKRDFFREQLKGSKFEPLPCRGTYFQLARYDSLSDLPDREFAQWMTREVGVAVIPVSVFYQDGRDDHVVRFCFAKRESTLAAAGEKLRRV
jgi:methionine aminotransferase